MPKNPEQIIITRDSDLAYIHQKFGLDTLIEFGASELMNVSDEIWEVFDYYLTVVMTEQKNYKKAIIRDFPDDWEELEDGQSHKQTHD